MANHIIQGKLIITTNMSVPKGYKMTTGETQFDDSKFYDMTARDSKAEGGQKFKMSADGEGETGRIKHSEKKDDTRGKI